MTDEHPSDVPVLLGTPVDGSQRIGRYALLRRLGQGGMAEVFLARQEGPSAFSKTVVIKRMLAHLTENKRYVEMFLREARVAARLNHQNVVQLFELGQDQQASPPTYFLAMEFIDGMSLHRLARRAWARGMSLPTEVIVRAMADAALGLHHAHSLVDDSGKPSGLVHRDISPDNLMITRDGITKVVDFGIAKTLEQHSGVTHTGELKGKIPFMSPEQIEGKPLTGQSDLFSLGVTFYWLLTGKRPFDAQNELMTLKRVLEQEAVPPSQLNTKVPAALDRVLLRLLEKDPRRRFRDGAHLHDKLSAMLGPDGGSRQSSVALVKDVMQGPAAEDDDYVVASSPQPASAPISKSFAPTDIVTVLAEQRRRGALLGVSAAVTLGFLVAVAFLLLNDQPAAVAPVAPLVVAVPTSAAPDAGVVPLPDAGTTLALADAGTAVPTPVVASVTRPKQRTVLLRGPAGASWRAGARRLSGPRAAVPPDRRSVTMSVARLGWSVEVPIVNDVADGTALPTGVLDVRALPYADVTLGNEVKGTTPFQPLVLPVGSYQLKLSLEGKQKVETVKVEAGRTTVIKRKMRE